MRGRGLKLNGQHLKTDDAIVAPRAGAWIETAAAWSCPAPSSTSPPVRGAWIDTGRFPAVAPAHAGIGLGVLGSYGKRKYVDFHTVAGLQLHWFCY